MPAGQISHTGVGGLTLGGGLGWLMRRHGLTIDSLHAAEVVLADGRIAQVSADESPDLFWALRGGGGDFGAVTSFEFRAHRVGPIILGGMLVYPWEQAADALRASRALMAGAPDDLTTFVALITAPPEAPFPEELQGRASPPSPPRGAGDLAEGERVLAPLRTGLPPALDLVGPMPYVALQSMLDQTAPHGWNYYDRQHYLHEVGDDFIDTLLAGFEQAPTPVAHVMTAWMGGAIDGVAPGETAFGHRGARALTWIIGSSGPEPLGPVTAWVRDLWDATAPFATGGVYVNALDAGRPARDAYAGDVWERLVDVKRRYDPDGVFEASGIRVRTRRAPRARRARPPRRGCARRACRARGRRGARRSSARSRAAGRSARSTARRRSVRAPRARGRSARRGRRARPRGRRRRDRAAGRRPRRRRGRAPSRSNASRAVRADPSASGEPLAR